MNELKSKGINAFLWDVMGKVSTQGITFLTTIFLARLLTPDDFGLIAMVMVVTSIAQVFIDIGLGTALIQKKRVLPIHFSSVFLFNLFIAATITLSVFLMAGQLADFYSVKKLEGIFEVTSFLFIINAIGSVPTTILRKDLKYSVISKVLLLSSIIGGAVGIFLAYQGVGVWSLIYQILIQAIIYNITILLSSGWTPHFAFSLKALKKLWVFGFRIFLSGLIDAIFTRLDYLIIGKILPIATLGYFQRAKQFNTLLITYTSGSLISVLFPALSKIQNSTEKVREVVLSIFHILCFIVFMLLGLLYIESQEIIVFLFTEKWLPSVELLKLLLLSSFAYPLSALLVNVLSSRGNSKAFLKLEILKKVLVSLSFFGLFIWGIEGYLYLLFIASFFSVLLNMWFVSIEIKLSFYSQFYPFMQQLLISISCVVITEFLSFSFVIAGFLYIGLFLLINLLLNSVVIQSVKKEVLNLKAMKNTNG
ncbi:MULTISPECIES: lipopolysaccharide biosynthesis protein [unclassified Pseudoalteromonas]|uniref:lipopolysaccharide biosynthesis protein n=1 Tax=unclassified Pseudoalteromonas TaxID=194690 RepID=UPI0023590F21|nr:MULTISPECIES: lipopolysaccharide biosynthesis protein [unclassified Pseudoalteromonas]MDC9565576.1 lipopolysaccharide biosynthesis protein [Pseudoalteromonas sp. GAB2316C]MDC9569919.1 lipopolysaccharide biosynthesis protein [Pseudoalteromonas sp. GABNB9D]MDC9574018.1 lipopolysaccharide biosynthesis protein [Pseudoalteromonas sp. GABNS16A]MDC9578124.1 lipopolysaccharide biosynthesis protein [Pseudoalteromonas sp. GABNS16E]MDC9584946.1 lipopolysaccharide biosynthesis protein [Pseudoalteromona